MNAHYLDTGANISADVLLAEGVCSARLPTDESGYRAGLEDLKVERGYVEEDVVSLSPQTPGLDELCAKFAVEHLHTEDEVRFVLSGQGVFDIRSTRDEWMRVAIGAGDMIIVPAQRHHRFMLSDSREIRCVRLFKDTAGWEPHYRG